MGHDGSHQEPYSQKFDLFQNAETKDVSPLYERIDSSQRKANFRKQSAFFGLSLLLIALGLFTIRNLKLKFRILAGIIGMFILIAARSKDENLQPSIGTSSIPEVSNLDTLNKVFGNFQGIATSSDSAWFYISGNGLPEHKVLEGITNWQQQVAIDQDFFGNNQWQTPVNPKISSQPTPMQHRFFKNAVGIAVNGIPVPSDKFRRRRIR